MATVQRPEERYVDFDEYIDIQLDKARSGIKWTDILAAAAGVAALVVAYLVLFVIADQWLFEGGIPVGLRQVLLGIVAVTAVGWIGWKVAWPYLRRVNDLYAAQMLERAEPSLRGSLFGLVDARRAGRPPVEEVRKALERRAATTLSDVDVDAALDRRLLMRMSYVLLGVVLFACVYAIASPKRVGPSLLRALLPTSNIGVATRTEILDVRPGDTTVLAGEQLPVSVMIRGESPDKVMLFYSTADRRFVDEPVELRLVDETTREYQTTLIGDAGRGLAQDLSYRIVANDDAAGPFAVEVDQPPAATIKTIALQFPPYTGMEPADRDAPPIEGIEGTNVALTAIANRPLKSAKLVFADDELFLGRGEEVPLRISEDGLTLTASWKLAIRSDGSSPTFFRIECRDTSGKTNPKPPVYPIKIVADAAPEVTLHDPKSDLERPANAIIPLLVTARDPDFRLRELSLRIEKRGQELPDRTVLWEGSAPDAAARHDWDLGPLALKPGDIVSFYVQARDNREPEANRRNTPKLNIKITEPVSKEDVQQQLAEEKQRQNEEIAEQEKNTDAADAEQQPNDEKLETAESETEKTQNDQQEQAENADRPNEPQPQDAAQGDQANQPNQGAKNNSDERDSVKNDGSQDDQVLRKLLQRQREQQQGEQDNADQPQDDQPPQKRQPNEADPSQQGEKQSGGPGDEGDSSNGSSKGGAQKQQPQPGERGEDRDETSNGSKGSEQPGQPKGQQPEGERSDDAANKDENSRPQNARPQNAADRTRKPQNDQAGNERSRDDKQSDANKQNQNSSAPDTNKTGPAGNEEAKGTGSPGQNASAKNSSQERTEKSAKGEGGNASEESDAERSDTKRQPSQPTDEPPGSADPNPGKGRPDQKSQRPDSGEHGTGQPNVDGTPDGQKGPGDAGTKPGSQQETNESTGQQGVKATEKGRPGEGTSEQANDGSPSSQQTPDSENQQPKSNASNSKQPASQSNPSTQQGESAKQSPSTQQQSPSTQQSDEPGTPQTSKQSENPQSNNPQGGKQEQPNAANQQNAPNQQNESPSNKTNSDQSKPDSSAKSEGESGENQSGKGESGKGETGKGETGKGETGKGETGKGESGKGESGKGESGKGESGKGESGKGAGKGESGKGESGKGESGKGESGESQSGSGESGAGETGGSGGQAGESGTPGQSGGKTGKPGGTPGAKGGQGGGAAPSDSAEGGTAEGAGKGDGRPSQANAEEANPEYTKQATDLALKKLQDDLARGDVDPELLKELGWTEADMHRFADRLRKNLEAPTGDETPAEAAQRKEFEHMLENLTIDSAPKSREGRNDRVRNIEGVGTKRPPIPSAYRAAYEAFTRRVAGRQSTSATPAATSDEKKP